MEKEKNITRITHSNRRNLGENDGYVYRYGNSGSYAAESHLHKCYEFVYITGGSPIYTVEGKEYFISPGDIIFTRPNELHSFSFPTKCKFERQFLHIYPDYLKKFPEILTVLSAPEYIGKNHIPFSIAEKYELDKIFNSLSRYTNDMPETSAVSYSYSILLIAKLNEIYRNEDFSELYIPKNKTIHKILQHISANITKTLSRDDIANAVFLSPTYLSSLFKQEMGMSITSYINMRRTVLAKNRILNNEKISSVYLQCGFENYSTFYRAFSKFVGMSPDEFKKNHAVL